MNLKFWTEEKIEELRLLYAQGYTGGQIGRMLGCTRNAIIGKAHRLGLVLSYRVSPKLVEDSMPKTRQRHYAKSKKKIRVRPRIYFDVEQQALVEPDKELPTMPVESMVEHESAEAIPLIELKSTSCRWPLWGQGPCTGMFCGAVKLVGSSYCADHSRVAYRPAMPRMSVRARFY